MLPFSFAVCDTIESGFSSCYVFVESNPLSWIAARARCQSEGGDLLLLSSDERFSALTAARATLGKSDLSHLTQP